MSGLHAAALWSGLNLVLLLALAIQVVRYRLKAGVALLDGGDTTLARTIRVHANAVEYIAPCLAGLAVMALAGSPAWAVHAGGALLFGGRIAHAMGLGTSAGPTPGRQVGMVATWLAMAWIAVFCLLAAF